MLGAVTALGAVPSILLLTATPAAAHAEADGSGGNSLRPLFLAVTFAAVVLASRGVTLRRPRWPWATAVSVAVLAYAAGEVSDAIHVVAASLWIGGVIDVALAWRTGTQREAAQAFTMPGLGLLGVVVVTGVRAASTHLGDAQLALGTWWGRTLALKITLVASAALVGALIRRQWAPRLESIVLTGVVGLGLLLGAASAPIPEFAASGPLSRSIEGGVVVVAPFAPGDNAVVVTTDHADVPPVVFDGKRVALSKSSAGAFVGVVKLRAGRHTLRVGDNPVERVAVGGGDPKTVVHANFAAPRATAECVDRIVGAGVAATALTKAGRPARLAVSGGAADCQVGPSAEDDAIDWEPALRLAAAKYPNMRLVRTPAEARNSKVPVVLAPWLLDGELVQTLTNKGTPVLLAALRDPTDALAVDYRNTATELGLSPTAAGLEGYIQFLADVAGAKATLPVPGIYAVSTVGVMPTDLGPAHESPGWAPNVALVKVA